MPVSPAAVSRRPSAAADVGGEDQVHAARQHDARPRPGSATPRMNGSHVMPASNAEWIRAAASQAPLVVDDRLDLLGGE